jgi:uncharacterized membrane protein
MVGQNVQGTHAELRAEHDLEVNVKAEEEIEVILRHLEYQNSMLIAMLSKLGVSVAEAQHPISSSYWTSPSTRSRSVSLWQNATRQSGQE